jgi:hypothetical protein
MGHNIKTGDSIVIAIDDKALSGRVIDTRCNSLGKPVIELELDESCGYKLVSRIDKGY